MVPDNGNWNYCSSILRRKGRRRWLSDQLEKIASHQCSEDRGKFPYQHFASGSGLLHWKHQSRTCLRQTWSNSNFFRKKILYNTLISSCSLYCFILLLILICFSFPIMSATTSDYHRTAISNSEICSSLDVRNNVEAFNQLTNCRVIEGFLQIVLMDRTNETDFANLTFPKLREITGYLLLYRVNGLKTLAHLFPNLSVIRGQDLFINYALAVYEMLHLQELGLASLTNISRGYVFITKNPLLCFVNTIDWMKFLNPNSTSDANLIAENRHNNACPKCQAQHGELCDYNKQTKQHLCWNNQFCQKTCPSICGRNGCTVDGECCDSHCLGGCWGRNSSECNACKNVIWNDICMKECPRGFFEFKGRRCITEEECINMPRSRDDISGNPGRSKPYKPHDGKCIIECPPKHSEVAYKDDKNEEHYKCEKCSGTCRKVCGAANIDSIQSAQKLKGCVIINGSLEIQIRGGGSIVKELEENLNMVEEITGYLKIVRSVSLVSLNFLRRLKLIKGDILENSKYVFVVLDNQNLAELWDFSRREPEFAIGRGRLFFHFNPKLCYKFIENLQNKLGIVQLDELDVARNSNGDKVACSIKPLKVTVAVIKHNYVTLSWIPYTHYEMRTLLGYTVYYIKVPPNVNVSVNDGRDGCGGDGWNKIDVDIADPGSSLRTGPNVTLPIQHLQPYTRYAFYVKTYTIATEKSGAQSPIQYFKTYPSTPTPPKQLKVSAISSSEIDIQWQPPVVANGNLIQYVVIVENTNIEQLKDGRDYCSESLDADKKDVSVVREEPPKKILPSSERKEECSCQPITVTSKIRKNDQEIQALIEFENKLHDSIYVKRTNLRTRRETAFLLSSKPPMKLLSNESNVLVENDSIIVTKPDLITSPKGFKKIVQANEMNIKFNNLTHFSEYTVYVHACREGMPGENDKSPPKCSSPQIETVQTLPLEEADRIDPKSVRVELLNETAGVQIRWEKPNITNGPILTYSIQFKRLDIEGQESQTRCITRSEFEKNGNLYKLTKLHAGNYSFVIQATSLAKDRGNNFTPPMYFQIKEEEQAIIHQLVLGAILAVVGLIIILLGVMITLRFFYPDTWYKRKFLLATVNPEYFKPVDGYDKWEIPRRKIELDNLLGIGHFGEVYEGHVRGIIQKGVTTKVAVKTLNKSPTNHRTWMSFLNEASVMKQFDTHHVVRLLGVVTKGEPLVIMELMAKGDLRTYLRSCRHDIPEEERKGPLEKPPTLKAILQMAAEIADGMLYLADKKFVHRDLAARNCMLNAEGTVKIGDFGLTRDVYETDYYRKDSKGHLPVRWMAPESLRDGIFSSRSDVWSYGVVLWEMATLASLPYTGLGNGEVMPYVINGGVMEEPVNCPPILAEIMKLCWQYKYSQRPSFSEVLKILLPNVREDFARVSYYHTEEARQLRASNAHADVLVEEDTVYTPLRTMEDFEDFSLFGDDENDEDNEGNVSEHLAAVNEEDLSSVHASALSLSTVNGYIRRPHVLPSVDSKTTSC